MPAAVQPIVERIGENCEPSLTTVLFVGGAGGSLRAGVTDNPVLLTRAIKQALVNVTCGGAPAYVWPGGGITVMVDVMRMPDHSFGTVPTPAIVAPIEFSMRLADYRALGGHMGHVRPLAQVLAQRRLAPRRRADRAALRARAGQPVAAGPGPAARVTPPPWPPQRARCPAAAGTSPHGPIDIVIGADGDAAAVRRRARGGVAALRAVLDELVAELPLLRAPVAGACRLQGVVARRMWRACRAVRGELHHADGGGPTRERGCYKPRQQMDAWY